MIMKNGDSVRILVVPNFASSTLVPICGNEPILTPPPRHKLLTILNTYNSRLHVEIYVENRKMAATPHCLPT